MFFIVLQSIVYFNVGKATSRILNGQEIPHNSKPYLVDVQGYCTGSIIGKKHVLTAAHCLDGWSGSEDDQKFIEGQYGVTEKTPEYSAIKYFFVGSHFKRKIKTNNGDVGIRMERAFVEGIHVIDVIGRNNFKYEIIRFNESLGLYPEYHIAAEKFRSRKKALDIALVTLTQEIRFSEFIQPVKIGPLAEDCRWCQGDCDDNSDLHAYGWGLRYKGKYYNTYLSFLSVARKLR